MGNKYTDFVKADKTEYISLIDEYRRFKYFRYQTKFDLPDDNLLFDYLILSFKHMFKIKREVVEGLEFGLNVKNTYTDYIIKEINYKTHHIQLDWNVDNDIYKLEFDVRKVGSKKTKLMFKQMIHREKTFFGMADYAGIFLYKRAFKSNMKTFAAYIEILIKNNGLFILDEETDHKKKKHDKTVVEPQPQKIKISDATRKASAKRNTKK